jgi:hypothetical protein
MFTLLGLDPQRTYRRGGNPKPSQQQNNWSIPMRPISIFAAVIALGGAAATVPAAVIITPFLFTSNISTDVPNTALGGDVLLDSVSTDGITIPNSQLQTVNGATIVLDNGVDTTNGGGNLASGRGIGAASDPLAPEGPATVTPTSADLEASQANFNLTSITVTRENVGVAVTDYTFAQPTNTFFYWERGIDSDADIFALNSSQQVIGALKIYRSAETPTGIFISTENGAFNITNQQLGSIGFQTSQPISELEIASVQYVPVGAAESADHGDDGPDYKILATAGSISAVPEPASAAGLAILGVTTLLHRRRGNPRQA